MNARSALRTLVAGSTVHTDSEREAAIVGCIVRSIVKSGRFDPRFVIEEAKAWGGVWACGLTADELRPVAQKYSAAYESTVLHPT